MKGGTEVEFFSVYCCSGMAGWTEEIGVRVVVPVLFFAFSGYPDLSEGGSC